MVFQTKRTVLSQSSLATLALVALCTPVFGQSNAITVTVSRNVDLSPDEVAFSLSISADPTATLDDVLQASQTLGLTPQSLLSVNLQQYGPSPSQVRLAYSFYLSVAYSKFRETNDKLAALGRALPTNTPPMDLQVFAIAVAASDSTRDQARLALLTPLFNDARQRADQLAKAAGVSLGGVVGMTEAWANGTQAAPYYGPYGPIGPNSLKTAFSLTVSYAVK